MALAVVSAQRLVRGSIPLNHPQMSGSGTTVRLSDHVTVPMLVGILRPTILLPADAATWSTERLESALRHEQAHILRRDIWWQLVTSITASLLWFQPLIWLAAKRLRVERELACDDLVLATGTPACDYAAHLLDFASQATGQTASPLTVAMAQPTTVEKRIRSILNPNARRTPLGRLAAGVITAITLLVALGTVALLPGGIGLSADGEVEVVEEETVQEEEQTLRIAGRIVDEENKPVGEAGFLVMLDATPELLKELQLTNEQRYVTGKANLRGEFQAEFPISAKSMAARKMTIRLFAQTKNRRIGEAEVLLETAQTVEVVVRPGKIVEYRHSTAKEVEIAQSTEPTATGAPRDHAHRKDRRRGSFRIPGGGGPLRNHARRIATGIGTAIPGIPD